MSKAAAIAAFYKRESTGHDTKTKYHRRGKRAVPGMPSPAARESTEAGNRLLSALRAEAPVCELTHEQAVARARAKLSELNKKGGMDKAFARNQHRC